MKAIFSFLIAIFYFKEIYPNFINVNIWDFLNYFFHEFLVSIIIGHSKKKTEDNNNNVAYDPKSFNINDQKEQLIFNGGSDLEN